MQHPEGGAHAHGERHGTHEASHDHDDPTHDHDHDHRHGDAHAHGDHGHEAHDHDGHDHGRGHGHEHGTGLWGALAGIFHFHGHAEERRALATDPVATNREGVRTIWLALAALSLTTAVQLVIVYWSGSVALLADTVHNFGDALNSIPLLLAFYLARRAANRRYTYGYGKAEDVAGIFIVLSIAVSAGVIFWESIQKLLAPTPIANPWWVAGAALVGFLGNEAVAWLQIRTGRRIGSAAMVADGLHARIDGLTSLAVLPAAGGSALGYPIVDPIVGLLIGVTILFIARDAAVTMWYRLMDAVDPEIVDRIERVASSVPGVQRVHDVRVRWLGHQLHADLAVIVDEDLTTRDSHAIAEEVRHALLHGQQYLSGVHVHVNPCGHSGADPHAALAHHTGGRG
ncbi:MAG TPA: cation diffusion facilitator family transporter [Roseiflexaceae bacterium]|nr:cation diffusion facilitator family transporter [Roseiflexaceae bacterium]